MKNKLILISVVSLSILFAGYGFLLSDTESSGNGDEDSVYADHIPQLLLARAPADPPITPSSKTSEMPEFRPPSWGLRPFAGANLGFLGGNSELKTGLAGGGELGLEGDYFMISLQIERYSRADMAVQLQKGSVSLTPIMFNFYGKFPLVKEGEYNKVTFKMGGGFDYIFVSHDLDNPQVGNTTITENIDSGVGFHVAGGLDYWIFKNLSVSQDFTYLFYQPNVTLTQTGPGFVIQNQFNISLNTLMAFFKVTYHF